MVGEKFLIACLQENPEKTRLTPFFSKGNSVFSEYGVMSSVSCRSGVQGTFRLRHPMNHLQEGDIQYIVGQIPSEANNPQFCSLQISVHYTWPSPSSR